jgi:hypothetical protein
VLAGLGGMTVPVVIFLALNTGRNSAAGWGVTMSTDTALALGLLAVVARGLPDRVRIFLLTVVVVDDLVDLLVIATERPGGARSAATGARHPQRNNAAAPRPYPLRPALLPTRRRSVGCAAGLRGRAGCARSCARAPHLGVRVRTR